MRAEFSLCLARGGSLEEVKTALTEQARQTHQQKLAKIDADYKSCLLIRAALQEPSTSPAFRVAEQFINEYRAMHEKILKSDRQITNDLLGIIGDDLTIDDPTERGIKK